jgi:membrane-associated phospholipid phosphatase
MARRRHLSLAAFGCAALAVLVYLAAMHVYAVQRLDVRVVDAFLSRSTHRSDTLARNVAYLFDPVPFAALAAVLVAAAVAAGRVRPGIAAGAAMLAANVTTQVLKPLLAAPRPMPHDLYVSPAAWPSGHTTAAVSLGLALVLISTPRMRPLAALAGAAIAAAAGLAVVALGWHYPSDVAGGALIAAGWSCLAAATVPARAPSRGRVGAPAPVPQR